MTKTLLSLAVICLLWAVSPYQAWAQDDPQEDQTEQQADDDATDDTDAAQDDATASGGTSANGLSTDQAVIDEGKKLFDANCAQCHGINKRMVGPALANVTDRQSVPWLVNFIKYPQRVIDSGDPYAVKLYEEYKQYMPNQDALGDENILKILSYIEWAQENEGTAATASGGGGGGGSDASKADGPASGLLLGIIIGLIVLLLVIAVVMALLVSVLVGYLRKEEGLAAEDEVLLNEKIFDIKAMLTNKVVIGLVSFILLAVVGKETLSGLYSVGVQRGYAPEQPIKFSHKLHAGFYEIDCEYCHTGASRGKSAVIPSANICMNCHGEIRQGSPEIQKIYQAIENDTPIQWVRIHNLTDLSYFNHSQHVNVAGLECQTCHGEVQEMEVVQQVSLLTMGWCINCHREQKVAAKDNDYYDRLIQLHENASKEPLKVSDIGGLECGKCHY
ncbi:MAG: c-type cytochrome [Bernardetiaceae bacterium]|nr:c-type cytochrome [Bernardetiaceae bacterium]